jgi:cation/acetate symporter
MYGGLAAAVILIFLSPVFWGTETSVFKVGTAIWPLNNPGIVSIPLGFFLGWLGSVTSRRAEDRRKAAEMEVRSLTGFGAEKATSH